MMSISDVLELTCDVLPVTCDVLQFSVAVSPGVMTSETLPHASSAAEPKEEVSMW